MKEAGTTDNSAGGSGASTSGNVTSGTASAAMIKAAEAASSAASPTGGQPAAASGDTSRAGGAAGASPNAAATGQGGGTGSGVPAAPTSSMIPLDRHQAALDNARKEATSRALADLARQNGMTPDQLTSRLSVLARMSADPRAFWQQLGQELVEAGMLEGNGQEEQMPEPDLVDSTGKIRTYSVEAHRKALDVFGRQLRNQLMGELRPALDFVEQSRTAQEEAHTREQAQTTTRAVMAEVRKLPHFSGENGANERVILETMRGLDPGFRQQLGPVGAMLYAYAQTLTSRLAEIEKTAEQRVRDEFAKKARVNGGAHPSDAGSGTGSAPKLETVDDLARHMERMAAAASA